MVLPVLLAAGGIAVASGIVQYMNSKEAREMSAAQYAQMQAMYDKLQQADFDTSVITPEDYKVLQTYVPEQAQFIAEQRPELVEGKSVGAVEGRQAQEEALRSLMAAGRGDDPRLKAAINQAAREAEISAGSQRESILQRFARQGQLTSGASLAAQLQGSSDAMDRAAMTGNQAAIQSYTDRLNALKSGADLGGTIRNEDISLEQKQKDAINAFNQRNTAAQREFETNRVNTANSAQLQNMQMAQSAADKNVAARNQAAINAQNTKNQYAQQTFQNNLNTINGRNGIASQQAANIIGAAQDKNAAIQGVTNAGITGAMGYADYDQRQQQLELERQKAGLGSSQATTGGSYTNTGNIG